MVRNTGHTIACAWASPPGAAGALAVAATLRTAKQQVVVDELEVGVLVHKNVLRVAVRAAEEEIVQRRLLHLRWGEALSVRAVV
jgi:hypothetical protein